MFHCFFKDWINLFHKGSGNEQRLQYFIVILEKPGNIVSLPGGSINQPMFHLHTCCLVYSSVIFYDAHSVHVFTTVNIDLIVTRMVYILLLDQFLK